MGGSRVFISVPLYKLSSPLYASFQLSQGTVCFIILFIVVTPWLGECLGCPVSTICLGWLVWFECSHCPMTALVPFHGRMKPVWHNCFETSFKTVSNQFIETCFAQGFLRNGFVETGFKVLIKWWRRDVYGVKWRRERF